MRLFPATLMILAASVCSAQQQPASTDREISWKKLAPNILEDQEVDLVVPRSTGPKGAILFRPQLFLLTGTALVIAADPRVAHSFRNTTNFNGFNQSMSGTVTSAAILAAPLALYGAGLLRRDSKMTGTALLAGEALADVEILTAVFKPVVSRWRPSTIQPNGNFADTFAEGGNRFSADHNSFPSGHTIAAFAVATVVSRRYGRQHRWVPILAYTGAAAIGFSRLTSSAHYPADVFVGAVLGYSISRFAVLRN